MPLISRRHLPLTLAPVLGLRAARLSRIGVQLYTLRTVLPKQPLETLRAVEEIGYAEVEAVGGDLPKIWDALTRTQLKPVSVHLDVPLFLGDPAGLGPALDDAKQKGFSFVVCPWVPPDQRSPEAMLRLGDSLNRAGKLARERGLTLCYHNHAFEFAPLDGGTMLSRLMKQTDPALVQLEFDIMWSQVAGVDPVKILEQYPGRVPLLHIKNVQAGVGPRFDERVPREAFRDAGGGVIDIARVLKAANRLGTKHFFVEQDQTPGPPLESLRISYAYLRELDY